MATWKRFEEEAPELAREVRARFEGHGTHVLATIRKDGSPRVSGSEVVFQGDEMTIGSNFGAMKARDLQRDDRCAIHAHPSDGDAKITARAVELSKEERQAMTADTEPPGDFLEYRFDLTEAVLTTVDQEEHSVVVQHWRPGQGVKKIEGS